MITFDKIRTLVSRSNPTIIEIGANDGKDTQSFLETFPFCTLIAFEPEPRAVRKFRQRIASDRVTLVESAVGAASGECTFFQSSGNMPNNNEDWAQNWDFSGSIKRPARHLVVHPWIKFESEIKVPVVTLDDWTRDRALRGIDFIWADVQGAERDVIRGAMETLKHTRYFYTEYSNLGLYADQPNLSEIKGLLPGFEVADVFQDDVLLRNTAL